MRFGESYSPVIKARLHWGKSLTIAAKRLTPCQINVLHPLPPKMYEVMLNAPEEKKKKTNVWGSQNPHHQPHRRCPRHRRPWRQVWRRTEDKAEYQKGNVTEPFHILRLSWRLELLSLCIHYITSRKNLELTKLPFLIDRSK